jgi:hypothetical protein
MYELEIRPGVDPADPNQIRIVYEGFEFSNVKVIEAHNDAGKLSAICEIKWEKGNGTELRDGKMVYPEIVSKPGKTGK